MRKKLLATLALLLMAATGAKAQYYYIVTFRANGNTVNKGVVFTASDDKTGRPCYKFECNESGNGELDNIMKTLDNRWTKCQKDETPTSSACEFITAGLNTDGCLCITIMGAWDAQVVEIKGYDVDGTTPLDYSLEVRCTNPFADINVTAHEGATGEYWATYYSSAWDYKADENTTVYQAAVNSGRTAVVLTEVTDKYIPKAQAVILKSSAPTITLSQPSSSETLTGNELLGVDFDTEAPSNAYCLSKGDKGVGFYAFTGTIPANRAYLVIASSARSFSIGGDDNTTGIETPEVVVVEGDGPIYDLLGRQVTGQPQKGIYVKNGKKVVIK